MPRTATFIGLLAMSSFIKNPYRETEQKPLHGTAGRGPFETKIPYVKNIAGAHKYVLCNKIENYGIVTSRRIAKKP